jgi:hypothetical protein
MYILALADKYDVPVLKTVCTNQVMKIVSKDNILQILPFADLYNAAELINTCVIVFIDNITEIMNTTEWQRFVLDQANVTVHYLMQHVNLANH